MSLSVAIESLKQNIVSLEAIHIADLKNSITGIGEWSGLSYSEYIERLDQLINDLPEIAKHQPLNMLPYTSIISINSGTENVISTAMAFLRERNSENFYSAARAVDGLFSLLITLGLAFPGGGMAKIHMLAAKIEPELSKLRTANDEAQDLKSSLRSLLTPTVSNALSMAFSTRSTRVKRIGYVWIILAAVAGAFAIGITIHSLSEINQAIANRFILIQNNKSVANEIDALFITQVVLRSAILIPLYVAFALFFSQYKKERNFEEEYAHKTAVAATIPSYGELVHNDDVRDQIVSSASAVIFSSPVERHATANANADITETLKGISGVIQSVEKLAPRK